MILTDANGKLTVVQLDDLGRVVKRTDQEGFVTEYGYRSTGQPERVEWYHEAHPAERSWLELGYYADGLLASVTDPAGVTRFTYTPSGALASVTDPDGLVTTFSYAAPHDRPIAREIAGSYGLTIGF